MQVKILSHNLQGVCNIPVKVQEENGLNFQFKTKKHFPFIEIT